MAKTFADFKRDMKEGITLTMVKSLFNEKLLNIPRKVIRVQSNGLWLETDNKSGKSFLEYPKTASLIEYDGKLLTIYRCSIRELTEEEKRIIDNCPSNRPENKEIVEMDMISDGSRSYFMDRAYYKENNADWYYDWKDGKKYSHNDGGKMWDRKIKGDVDLQYKIN